MNVFIELWSANDNWKNLSQSDRGDYLAKMKPTIPIFLEKGAQIMAWGRNDKIDDHPSEYDYYAIWTFPNEELIDEFKSLLNQANWYHYFDQVNVCGEGGAPDAVIGDMMTRN